MLKRLLRIMRRELANDILIVLHWSQWIMKSLDARLVENSVELDRFLQPLVEAGVDIFHCSTRCFWEQAFPGSDITLAGLTKKLTELPTIAVGSVGLPQDSLARNHGDNSISSETIYVELEKRLKSGEFDLITLGRALISDHMWVKSSSRAYRHY